MARKILIYGKKFGKSKKEIELLADIRKRQPKEIKPQNSCACGGPLGSKDKHRIPAIETNER